MNPALLVIDMQQIFFNTKPTAAASLDAAVETINSAIELFREKNLPVLIIEDVKEPDGRVPGSPGFETTDRLHLKESDPRIRKTYGNAFNHTGLDALLAKQEVDTLILTGFAASRCVLSTSRGARDLDFLPVLLRGALADYTRDRIGFVEGLEPLISLDVLRAFFELL